MIFNRTQYDISESVRIREEKIKKGVELSESDINILERGMMTVSTLNRIEAAQETLKNLINNLGYFNTPIYNKEWGNSDIFSMDDFQRIINNTNILRNAFFVYKSTPRTPPVSYKYDDINSLERILYDLDLMISDVKSLYAECGNIESGE